MHLNELLNPVAGLGLGLLVGFTFGTIQDAARKRHERRQEQKAKLNNGWLNVPGSMTRVAILLGSLGIAQILFPALFTGGNQWSVSAGVALGYGLPLIYRLRQLKGESV